MTARKSASCSRSFAVSGCFFSHPRGKATASDASPTFNPSRGTAAVARELTKLFEEVRRAPLSKLAAYYAAHPDVKGEIVIVIGAPSAETERSAGEVDEALREAMAGASVKDAAAEIAARFGLKRRDVYARALEMKRGAP